MPRRRKLPSGPIPSAQGSKFGAALKEQYVSSSIKDKAPPPIPQLDRSSKIQADLENKFSPPLDTSLIVALLSECDLSPSSISDLHQQLSQLASQAEAESLSSESLPPTSRFHGSVSVENDASTSTSTATTTSPSGSATTSTPEAESASSESTNLSFSTPLGFLQAAFPDLPTLLLQDALSTSPTPSAQPNMPSIVESLLNQEFIREEIERGFILDPYLDRDSLQVRGEDIEEASRRVEKWKGKQKEFDLAFSQSQSFSQEKKGKGKSRTVVPVIDVRQRQHTPLKRPIGAAIAPHYDVWTHLSSLSDQLATLIPSTTPNTFLSLFHSPQNPYPAAALRSFLSKRSLTATLDMDQNLAALIEILGTEDSIRIQDAKLSVGVCRTVVDALDLVLLLKDLDEMGDVIVHFVPEDLRPTATPPVSPVPSEGRGPPIRSYSLGLTSSTSTPHPQQQGQKPTSKPSPDTWTQVPPRRSKSQNQHYLSDFIPSYNPTSPSPRSPNPTAPEDDVESYRSLVVEYRKRREEALKEASRQWQSGGRYGGEIALYYAEEARVFEGQSREWGLRRARALVRRYQENINDPYTLDLHGLTLQESYTIVREIVNAWHSSSSASPLRPLNIITGIGKHSKGQVSILAPAVARMLEADGWIVKKGEGKLVVVG